jgi:sec-independent protein translocase protein TatA
MGDLLAPTHLLIILLIVVFLFGGRKIPELARGLGEGIRSFKEGMSGNSQTPTPPAQTPPSATTEKPGEEKK